MITLEYTNFNKYLRLKGLSVNSPVISTVFGALYTCVSSFSAPKAILQTKNKHKKIAQYFMNLE